MANQSYLLLCVFACVAVTCFGAVSRHKRQASALCPSSDGRFPVDGDCHRFMECSGGIANIIMCPHRLAFNPQTQLCDRPGNVNGCQDQGHPSDTLCDTNRGTPGEAWKVAHPNFCNAFYTCEEHYIHKRCEFCGEGTYFSDVSGYCVALNKDGSSDDCSGKQIVPHSQKAILEVYPDCNLFQSNPYQRLLNRIEAESGGRPTGGQTGGQGGGAPNPQARAFVTNQRLVGGQPVVFFNPLPVTVLNTAPYGK